MANQHIQASRAPGNDSTIMEHSNNQNNNLVSDGRPSESIIRNSISFEPKTYRLFRITFLAGLLIENVILMAGMLLLVIMDNPLDENSKSAGYCLLCALLIVLNTILIQGVTCEAAAVIWLGSFINTVTILVGILAFVTHLRYVHNQEDNRVILWSLVLVEFIVKTVFCIFEINFLEFKRDYQENYNLENVGQSSTSQQT